ncbi:hypothetical protein [Deinococcus piscis]|nr:hypothetical protein [Deinococcus piscis]
MSAQQHSLDVRGYRDDALEYVYQQQETPTGKLGLLLPGMGYGLEQPGLKYATSVLDELGFDTFGLETRYHTPAFADAPADEAAR